MIDIDIDDFFFVIHCFNFLSFKCI